MTTKIYRLKEMFVHSEGEVFYFTLIFDTWDLYIYRYLIEKNGFNCDKVKYLGTNLTYKCGKYLLDIFKIPSTMSNISISII
jgi:hypothetical protein